MIGALQDFAYRISERAEYAELQVQRALGADWIDAYRASWRVMDEVYALVMEPERPAVYEAPRMICHPNSKGLWA